MCSAPNRFQRFITDRIEEGIKAFKSAVCLCFRLLELGLEGKVIRSQDLSHLILMVARNPQGHNLAWNFVKKNWHTLVQRLVLC